MVQNCAWYYSAFVFCDKIKSTRIKTAAITAAVFVRVDLR